MHVEIDFPDADEPMLRSALLAPITSVDEESISADDFQSTFGESIAQTLNLDTWRSGPNFADEYERIETEVRRAVERETNYHQVIRDKLFSRLPDRKRAPKHAGQYLADMSVIKQIHSDLLFSGGVDACDGNMLVHETLPLTIFQMGVTLVSYQGDGGSFSHRLYRRDLKQAGADRLQQMIDMLEDRSTWGQVNSKFTNIGEMVRKAMLGCMERAVLAKRANAPWRIGHGNPIPYEVLTGGGNMELMVESTNMIRELFERQQKVIFVAREPNDPLLMTIGQALRPMEYAVVQKLDEQLDNWLHQQRFRSKVGVKLKWDDEEIPATDWIPRMIEQVASKIVVGLFRASEIAPSHVFYAQEDHVELAAHIVLADSVLQENRGSPMLLEMARTMSQTAFGTQLSQLAHSAFAAAGAPWRYSTSS